MLATGYTNNHSENVVAVFSPKVGQTTWPSNTTVSVRCPASARGSVENEGLHIRPLYAGRDWPPSCSLFSLQPYSDAAAQDFGTQASNQFQ